MSVSLTLLSKLSSFCLSVCVLVYLQPRCSFSCTQRAAQVSSEQLMEEELQDEREEMIYNRLNFCFHWNVNSFTLNCRSGTFPRQTPAECLLFFFCCLEFAESCRVTFGAVRLFYRLWISSRTPIKMCLEQIIFSLLCLLFYEHSVLLLRIIQFIGTQIKTNKCSNEKTHFDGNKQETWIFWLH